MCVCVCVCVCECTGWGSLLVPLSPALRTDVYNGTQLCSGN